LCDVGCEFAAYGTWRWRRQWRSTIESRDMSVMTEDRDIKMCTSFNLKKRTLRAEYSSVGTPHNTAIQFIVVMFFKVWNVFIAIWMFLHLRYRWYSTRTTRMWANAKRHGRPPPNIGGALCSTPQSLVYATTRCRSVTLPRRETRWNSLGCPKLPNRSEPLLYRSSLYCEDARRTYCCLRGFLRLSVRALVKFIN